MDGIVRRQCNLKGISDCRAVACESRCRRHGAAACRTTLNEGGAPGEVGEAQTGVLTMRLNVIGEVQQTWQRSITRRANSDLYA